jgi:hypothetical protein
MLMRMLDIHLTDMVGYELNLLRFGLIVEVTGSSMLHESGTGLLCPLEM